MVLVLGPGGQCTNVVREITGLPPYAHDCGHNKHRPKTNTEFPQTCWVKYLYKYYTNCLLTHPIHPFIYATHPPQTLPCIGMPRIFTGDLSDPSLAGPPFQRCTAVNYCWPGMKIHVRLLSGDGPEGQRFHCVQHCTTNPPATNKNMCMFW